MTTYVTYVRHFYSPFTTHSRVELREREKMFSSHEGKLASGFLPPSLSVSLLEVSPSLAVTGLGRYRRGSKISGRKRLYFTKQRRHTIISRKARPWLENRWNAGLSAAIS